MKQLFSLSALLLFILGLTGCGTKNVEIEINEDTGDIVEQVTGDEIDEEGIDAVNPWNLNDVITYYLINNLGCNDERSHNFVNIAYLGEKDLGNGYSDYYIYAHGQGYYVDSRGNLTASCGYAIPIKLNVNHENGTYAVNDYETAKDGSEYMDSLKEIFSDEAIEILTKEEYVFEDNRTLLEMAEESLGVKIIPDEKEIYSCEFCDKLWYYEENENEDEEGGSNELNFNYVAKDNGKNTIFFGSDGKFEAAGSWDAGKGTWTFGNNKNSVIVSDSNNDSVYSRYIITNVDEENLNTILEIIQK